MLVPLGIYPKSIVWSLCFPVCPLPFAPNHTHNTPLPAEAKGASGSQMGMFPDLIWTWTQNVVWKWSLDALKSRLSLKNIELNHRQVWKLIILWNIIYRGKCKPCSKYLPANIWIWIHWKWERNTHACMYLYQSFPQMDLFQSLNKNYTFWPFSTNSYSYQTVTNKIPFPFFPQPFSPQGEMRSKGPKSQPEAHVPSESLSSSPFFKEGQSKERFLSI